MPAITINDLSNAKLDVDHISDFATTAAPTVTDRLGNVKPSIAGLSAEYPNASVNAAAAAAEAFASEVSRKASGVSAGQAVEAKTAAEAARDASQLSAGIYGTAALGITATNALANKYFSVPSPESAEYLILYFNNAGAAEEVKRYPSSASYLGGYDAGGAAWAIVDASQNIAIAVRPDGTFDIGSQVDVGAAIPGAKIATNNLTEQPPGSGYVWGVADSAGNLAVAIFSDGRTEIAGLPVAPQTQVDILNSTVLGTKTVVCWGDSLTEGAGATAGQTYPAQLGALVGAMPINEGFGSQNTAQITARQGGNAAMVTAAGNLIPSSGSVAVTLDMNLLQYPTAATLSIKGFLGGVLGTLTKDTSNNYIFLRTATGAAVIAAPSTPFIVTQSTRNIGNINLDQAINIFWCGSNDVGVAGISTVQMNVDKSIAKLSPNKRFLVIGPINHAAYTASTQAYVDMRLTIDAMKSKWPRNFIDVQALLVENYNAGIPQDVTDYANKVVPSSLRADAIHLNNAGYAIVAAAVQSHLNLKGWLL